MNIAVLGAESTGKTWLTREIVAQFEMRGQSTCLIPEALREWCAREGRTPEQAEQFAIAREQADRLIGSDRCDAVICDTTPLMTAVYSDWRFGDHTLHDFAIQHQKNYALTLVMGLDLPWVADAHQRDGPQSREPVDALLRLTLELAGIPYFTVYGTGSRRIQNAMSAIFHGYRAKKAETPPSHTSAPINRVWSCDKCGDATCERHLFRGLLPDLSLDRRIAR